MQFNGFGSFSNIITNVTNSDYKEVSSYIELLKGVARVSKHNLYLLDFYKGAVLFLNENPDFSEEATAEQLLENHSRFKVDFATPEEHQNTIKAIKCWFHFLEKEELEQRIQYTFEFDYKIQKRIINASFTPIKLCNDGKPWLVLCTTRTSVNSKSGNIRLLKKRTPYFWSYSSTTQEWKINKSLILSDIEKEVIRLSIQGKREAEICECIYRSKDGLKSIKKKMFRKMKVRNITEAVSFALSYGLI